MTAAARRIGRVLLPALLIVIAGFATRPLGPLAGTMLLVLTLPPLALSLDALGWAEIAAAQIRRARLSMTGELVAAYSGWLAISAILTLDVAAVVAVPVGLRVASTQDDQSSIDHLGAAILGSNVGSLLFPFSNLTNLILVSATGISFGAYLGAAWLPQILAALAVGVLLVFRTRRAAQHQTPAEPAVPGAPSVAPSPRPAALTLGGGAVALAGAISAVVVGLAGGDVAPVFAATAAVVAGCAIAANGGPIGPLELARSIPLSGVAVVLFAAVAVGLFSGLASHLPHIPPDVPAIVGLPLIALVGGLLAVTVNNLPAAAFGAIWLVGASPAAVVAYLIGTNLFAIATPHGSLATILSRQLGLRGGVDLGVRDYVRAAWRYALVSSVVAVIGLIVVR
jgi:arsenical pump membrane protein